jgi:hypothetical protein
VKVYVLDMSDGEMTWRQGVFSSTDKAKAHADLRDPPCVGYPWHTTPYGFQRDDKGGYSWIIEEVTLDVPEPE